MIRQNLIDDILRIVYNGIPTEDAGISRAYINQLINQGIATVIREFYSLSLKVDGVGEVPDGFYVSLSGFDIQKDPLTGYYYFTLPQTPVSFPKDKGIGELFIINRSGARVEGIRISQREIPLIFMLPFVTNFVYFWVEGNTLRMWSKRDVTQENCYVRMVYSESSDLSSELNCPPDLVPDVVTYVVGLLTKEKAQPMNTSNEGVDTPNIKM